MPVPVRRGYANTSSGQVHYRHAGMTVGDGPAPLICLHMSPATGFVYERLLGRMGADRIVVAPDTPGFGSSDAPPAFPGIADYARILLEFIIDIGVPTPVDVLGYHTGASIGAEMVRQAPSLVRCLVMISAPVFSADDLAAIRPSYREETLFTADGERLRAKWLWFQEFLGVGRDNSREYAAQVFVERLSGKDRHWWGHRAAFAYDLAATLRALDREATILNPADDLTLITRRAVAGLGRHQLVELPHLTHGFLDSHTEEVATLLQSMLAEGSSSQNRQ